MQVDSTAGPNPALSWPEWRVLVLLVLSGLLNYIDRSNLSIGATNIQHELHLSDYQLGLMLSAFFWTYALAQLCYVAGWLVDRLNVSWILAGGVALWSMATTVSGFAHSFALLFGLRLLLGAGESIAYPSYSRILVTCYPEHHRGFSNAAIDAGTKMGPAIGALIGGLLIARIGWRPFFIGLGVVSFLWVIPWILWMPRSKRLAAGDDTEATPGFVELLLQPKLWWTALGLFGSNYFWYFLITWLPSYLEKERNFPKSKMAVFSSLAYLAIAVSSVTAGRLSDFWIAIGGPVTRVRMTIAATGLGLSSVLLLVPTTHDVRGAMALLMFACVSFGMYTSNVFAITQTLAGPAAAGRWTGVQNGIGNLAGVAAPWITGWAVERSGHFFLAFLAATAAVLISAASFVFGVRGLDPVKWKN